MLKKNTQKTRVFEVKNSIRSNNEEVLKLTKEEFITFIEETIELHDKYKGAYFWTPPSTANDRKNRPIWESGERNFFYEGHEYWYELSIDYSCKNTYLNCNKMGCDEGGDVRSWKKLLKTLKPEENEKTNEDEKKEEK